MSKLTRDGTAEPVSRDQILRRERGQGNIIFPCSADHEQDRQPYPVDPCSCYMCDHTIRGHTWGHWKGNQKGNWPLTTEVMLYPQEETIRWRHKFKVEKRTENPCTPRGVSPPPLTGNNFKLKKFRALHGSALGNRRKWYGLGVPRFFKRCGIWYLSLRYDGTFAHITVFQMVFGYGIPTLR